MTRRLSDDGQADEKAAKQPGASNGTRTRDIQDHNLALYQLSYARHPRGAV
jgi:hypothetical protein